MGAMRVLLVDDEPELVTTMAERLELRGFEVDAVTNGTDAVARARDKAFDIAVVDVKMPGMDGYQVMGHLRQIDPRMPVILLTGHGATEETQDVLEAEACAYLYKPIDIEELIRTMKSCVPEVGSDD